MRFTRVTDQIYWKGHYRPERKDLCCGQGQSPAERDAEPQRQRESPWRAISLATTYRSLRWRTSWRAGRDRALRSLPGSSRRLSRLKAPSVDDVRFVMIIGQD